MVEATVPLRLLVCSPVYLLNAFHTRYRCTWTVRDKSLFYAQTSKVAHIEIRIVLSKVEMPVVESIFVFSKQTSPAQEIVRVTVTVTVTSSATVTVTATGYLYQS